MTFPAILTPFKTENGVQGIPIMRITTVTKNPKPDPIALIRKRRLSKTILAEYPGDENSNSEVMSSMIAVTASHKLISDIDSGKIMVLT